MSFPPPPPPPGRPGSSQYSPPGYVPYQTQHHSKPPADMLIWSILATLFCCLPLGIAGIIYAAQARTQWSAGDHQSAYSSAQKAKTLTILSAVAGLLILPLVVMLDTGATT